MDCCQSKDKSVLHHDFGLPNVQLSGKITMKLKINCLLVAGLFFCNTSAHSQEIKINCIGNTFTANTLFPEEKFQNADTKIYVLKDNKLKGLEVCQIADQYSAYCNTPRIDFPDTPGRYISISTRLNRINGQIEETVTDHQPIAMLLQKNPNAEPYLKGHTEIRKELIFRGTCEQIKGQKF